jgi:hypothetical protein
VVIVLHCTGTPRQRFGARQPSGATRQAAAVRDRAETQSSAGGSPAGIADGFSITAILNKIGVVRNEFLSYCILSSVLLFIFAEDMARDFILIRRGMNLAAPMPVGE